jgi:predicted exporter
VAGIAAVSLVFGSVHGITLGFGATLLGEGVDYAIYLFSTTARSSTERAATASLWRTLRLGVLTSVCGFGAMLFSDFPGLAQLGLFSITGLVVAFAVTRLALPEMGPTRYQPAAAFGAFLLGAVRMLSRLRMALLVLVTAAATVLIWRGGAAWDDRLERLSPVPEADKQMDARLRRDLGAPDVRYLVVIFEPQQQAALETAERVGQVLERLREQGALAGFESPAAILPSAKTQRERQDALPDRATLERRLSQAMDGLPFRPGAFQPFLSDVASAKQAPLLRREDLEASGLKLRFDALLTERHGGWVATLPLRGVQDAGTVAVAIEDLQSSAVSLLDLKREADALYRGYRGQALVFALIGAGAIVVLLLISLRSVTRTFYVLAPLVAALIVTSAVLTLGGNRLTMFHLVGMLLVVGVGSNYTLLFEPRAFAAGDAQRTVTSVVLCNASTTIGFGLLALAHAPVLSDIGATVALGALLSLLCAAILAKQVRGVN